MSSETLTYDGKIHNIFKDTYFLNSQLALETALQNNKVLAPNNQVEGLQVCYYDGEKREDTPINCINVPFANMIEYFTKTKNRIPSILNIRYSKNNKEKTESIFNQNIDKINIILKNQIDILENKIKNLKPDFNDRILRIFAFGCRETVLIKYLVKNILDATKNLGYDVYLHQQTNDIQGCGKVHYLEAIYSFNPHIIININHINNHFLHDDIFNFVWFQDVMPILIDNSEITLRERDFIFHLTRGIGELILNKNITSEYQSFCINNNVYKNRHNIKRKRKVVMIGSSYYQNFIGLRHYAKDELCKILFDEYLENGVITENNRSYLMSKFDIPNIDLGHIVNYIERDLSLKYIAKLNLNCDLEIYGNGFDTIAELAPYYKGVLKYGEDISKVYNSAMYCLVLGGYVMQQRTLESAASGCIPIVIDSRNNKSSEDGKCFNESLVFMKKLDDLPSLLDKEHDLDLDCIVKANSYEHLASKIIALVKGNL